MNRPLPLLILVITAGITLGVYLVNFQHKKTETRLQLKHLANALKDFQTNCKRYPSTQEGLIVLFVPPKDCSGWKLPTKFKTPPIDPWGSSYHYEFEEGVFRVISPGRDRLIGGRGLNQDIVFESTPI